MVVLVLSGFYDSGKFILKQASKEESIVVVLVLSGVDDSGEFTLQQESKHNLCMNISQHY